MIGQLFSGIASAWLLTSVLLWNHGPAQLINALVVGTVALLALPASYFYPKLRFVIAGAAYWLFASSLTVFFMTDSVLTAGNHIATSVVMLVSAIGPFSGITVIPAPQQAPAAVAPPQQQQLSRAA
ncbi:MAG TPA: hypothetical protein VNO55_18875 [Polyangia bacterium]|nr:hypothetical protein [Polyangia bacterium]